MRSLFTPTWERALGAAQRLDAQYEMYPWYWAARVRQDVHGTIYIVVEVEAPYVRHMPTAIDDFAVEARAVPCVKH